MSTATNSFVLIFILGELTFFCTRSKMGCIPRSGLANNIAATHLCDLVGIINDIYCNIGFSGSGTAVFREAIKKQVQFRPLYFININCQSKTKMQGV